MGTTGRSAFSVIGVQGAAITASALVVTLWGLPSGVSVVLGGFSILLPNAIFAWASTRRRDGAWLLVQGIVKFLLAIVMMAIAIRHFSPEPLAFFTGVIVALLAHALGGFWLQSQTPFREGPGRANSGEQ